MTDLLIDNLNGLSLLVGSVTMLTATVLLAYIGWTICGQLIDNE